MEGVFINKLNTDNNTPEVNSAGVKLLAKFGDMEIMEQSFIAGDTVWLSPPTDSNAWEFYFILSGEAELELDDETCLLRPGDSFTLQGLKRDIIVKSKFDTKILYFSNTPIYNEKKDFEVYLKALITQIDSKDHYTARHSMNVMNYALKIYETMFESFKDVDNEAKLKDVKDIAVASLFHDVGKCNTPDEILKKKGKLESEEMKVIRHHPVDTGRLLRKYYNNRIAEIAENHHERIDGSGYPFGLSGHELSTEAKILAVVDAFDAMTTDRGYNNVKSFADAAEELYNLPHLFDHEVASVLKRLVDEGKIAQARKKNDGQQ